MSSAIESLSSREARRIVLDCQGLARKAPFGTGKQAVLSALEHLSYVQIDTISVVQRAHHHVLWSRVPDYRPTMLHELQCEDRRIFEYWSHAASYLPLRDYRFSLPRKKAYADGKAHWFQHNRKVMKLVLERIRKEGPLQARDFEAPAGRKSMGWFDWKPSKIALEQLFMAGELMISERRGFQKVYDLTERVLPEGTDTRFPAVHETARYWADCAVRSSGIVTEQEIRYQRRGFRPELTQVLHDLVDEGVITRVHIENAGKEVLYASVQALARLSDSRGTDPKEFRILSPFDNLVIQRKRLKRIFDFDYQIECYTPEAKRKYGYFCLPLLHGDELIGRVDCKADRVSKVLSVNGLFIERPRVRWKEHKEAFQVALQGFAEFNGCRVWV